MGYVRGRGDGSHSFRELLGSASQVALNELLRLHPGHRKSVGVGALGIDDRILDDHTNGDGNLPTAVGLRTSKSGAVMCLLSRAQRARAATVAGGVRHVELSTLPRFERLLAEKMAFPSRGQAGAERHPRELVKRAPAPVRS